MIVEYRQIEILAGAITSPRTVHVDAVVFGEWAAHESYQRDGWTVTLAADGRAMPEAVSGPLTAAEALTVAAHLEWSRIDGRVVNWFMAEALIAEALDEEEL